MKLNALSTLLSVAVATGMMSCTTSVVSDDPQPVNPTTETKTINVRVVSNDFTRAGEEDNAIETLYLAFYKGDANDPIFTGKAKINNDNKTYSIELPVDPFNVPDRVVAYANIADENSINNNPIDVIQNEDGTLIMSSATYFEGSGDASKLINSSPITAENITSDTPVDIYLDRVVAKVSVTKDTNMTLTGPEVNEEGTQLTMEIAGWGLTATDKSSSLMKQISDSYSEVSALLGNWAWNNPDKHTLHWAQSVNYGKLSESAEINKIKLSDADKQIGEFIY